jgi:hypothetical protein
LQAQLIGGRQGLRDFSIGKQEGGHVRSFGNRNVSPSELAQVYFDLLDVQVRVVFTARFERAAKSLVADAKAQDVIAVHAFMPSHTTPPSKSLRRKGLSTIDAKPTRRQHWHQIGIIFGVEFSQRQEIKRF